MTTMIKRALLKAIRGLGYELAPAQRRVSMEGVLNQAARLGLAPATVLDVGAARGDFTRLASARFPKARFVAVEPLYEFDSQLERLCAETGARRVKAAAGRAKGETVFNVHADLMGSSCFSEAEEGVDGQPRRVPLVALDDLAAEMELPGPYLLKIDTQGAEIEALMGASRLLAETEFVILEVSFLPFFKGGPLFADVVAFMTERGFALYDIAALAHRPLDGALAQADVAFARADGFLRHDGRFATPEQRARLTERLLKS